MSGRTRHKITVGYDSQGVAVELTPTQLVLIVGSSGIGKSTLATSLTEKMVAHGFQFSIFDPEGDYEELDHAVSVGHAKSPPSIKQVIQLLEDPSHNVVVNTLGLDLQERPPFFAQLGPQLASLKASTGRPHWLIIDEAHHLMPAAQESTAVALPKQPGGTIFITVHPDAVSPAALKALSVVVALGPQAAKLLQQISQIVGEPLPMAIARAPADDELLLWQRGPLPSIKTIKADKPKQQHKRHTRKYAEGHLDEERSFYFRGPKEALCLRAQNLIIFLQMAEGIDDATWMHHLQKKDYSDWFRRCIKDEALADAALTIESDGSLSPSQSRQAIAQLVKELYTAPASGKD